MKKFVVVLLASAAIAAATTVGVWCEALTPTFRAWVNAVEPVFEHVGDTIAANPVPVLIAAGTFIFTIGYQTLKSRALRRSLAAATSVAASSSLPESPVVARAKARATRAQLIADQIQLENRLRKLPGEVKAAEKDACYTEQAVQDARRLLETKLKAHDEALAKLDQLHEELMASEAELAAINAELEKLAEQV